MNSSSLSTLRPNPDTRQMFNATAGEYNPFEWFDRSPRSPFAFAVTRNRLLELMALDGDQSVLEVGCGPGTWTREIAPVARSVLAVDISAEMVQRAQNFVSSPIVSFHVEDFATWQIDQQFDRVVSVRAVEYMRDGIQAVEKLGKFVRPGGRLVVITKTPVSVWRGRRFVESRFQRLLGSHSPRSETAEQAGFYHTRLSPSRLKRALEHAGFQDVSLHPVVTGLPLVAGVRGDIPIIPSRLSGRALKVMNQTSDWINGRSPGVVLNSLWLTESFAVCARVPTDRR